MIAAVRDGITFTRNLTRKRIRNALRVHRGFKNALKSNALWHPAFPLSLSVEPTTSCNLRCPECPSGLRSFTRPTGMMQMETFTKIIDELADYLLYLILYFQGEPFLNPVFHQAVRYANAKRIYTSTSTNAHFLTPEAARETVLSGLNRIIISLDGTNQETYEKYRIGGQLEKVIAGVQNLTAARRALRTRSPYIVLQFLLFRHNTHQLNEARQLARELGVDRLEFKTAQVYEFETGSDLIPLEEQYSRYRQNGNGAYHIKNEHLNKCWKMWHSCVMTWDGNIVPCCFDKDAKYMMGNIIDQPFREIWNGDRYRAFRRRLFSNRKEIDICKNCTEGLRV